MEQSSNYCVCVICGKTTSERFFLPAINPYHSDGKFIFLCLECAEVLHEKAKEPDIVDKLPLEFGEGISNYLECLIAMVKSEKPQ